MTRERRETIDGLPVVLVEPAAGGASRPLVLWLTHLGGSNDQAVPMLERLAELGHPAVSFDPPGHGERATTPDPWAMAARTLAHFRRRMWPLLGQTVLESLRVLDWAVAQVTPPGIVAGGVSMGGDVAVALAGVDERIARVATVGSTPDWSRPGMAELGAPDRPLDQGTADRYAGWLRERLDPMLHLDRYARVVPIAFEGGADDHHVPLANAEAFTAALAERHPDAGAAVRVTAHPGLDHLGVTRDPTALGACASWLGA